jgi:CBS domain-containing protein
MNVATILATKGTNVMTIRPDQSVRAAVAVLVEHNIGALVVVDEAGQPIGMLSERAIIRASAKDEQVFSKSISDVMNRNFIVGGPHDDLHVVAHTMTEKRFRHVVITDGGKLIGIISIGDIVKAQRDQYEGELYTLQMQILADET